MAELSFERIEQIVYKETPKTDVLPTILRSVYVRYIHLYESYFADIDALNDEKIAELNKYHEETKSLVKYYYMDIPKDLCGEIEEFDDDYTAKLLGADWHKLLFDVYKEFAAQDENRNKSEQCLKAAFSAECLKAFYAEMEGIFRASFGTASKVTENIISGLGKLLGWNKE